MYLLIFFHAFPSWKQVGLTSFYQFYEIRISPLIFRPEIMNRSNSFLNVLNAFADFFSSISRVETSLYILILSLVRNSNFTPPLPYIMKVSNSFLTVLKVFPDFFSCVSGLETSQHIFILSILRNSNFTP